MKKLTKVFKKPVGTPKTNKEAFDYLNKKNEALSLLKNELNLYIE